MGLFIAFSTPAVPCTFTAALVNLGSYLVMIVLHPHPDNTWVLLILAAAIGFSAGIWRLHFGMLVFPLISVCPDFHPHIFHMSFSVNKSYILFWSYWINECNDANEFYNVPFYPISALFGIVFSSQPDAAFAARTTLASLGAMIAYMYSNFICTSTKLFIVTSLLIVSYVGYLTVEIMYRRSNESYTISKPPVNIAVVEIDHSNKALNESEEKFKKSTF